MEIIINSEKNKMQQNLGGIGNTKPEFTDKTLVILEHEKKLKYEKIKEGIRREKIKIARYGSDLQLLTLLSKDCDTLIRHRVAINKNTPKNILLEIANRDVSERIRLVALNQLKKRS